MEYTNEFLARVYGAYIGSNIIMPKSGRIAKLQGVDFDGAIIHLNDGEDHRNFEYFPFKLILTPIPEISDEDAIEVAKCIYREIPAYHNSAIGKEAINKLTINQIATNINGQEWGSIIDFLRSKGYDCGYGELPSLIEAGIAIKKQQP